MQKNFRFRFLQSGFYNPSQALAGILGGKDDFSSSIGSFPLDNLFYSMQPGDI